MSLFQSPVEIITPGALPTVKTITLPLTQTFLATAPPASIQLLAGKPKTVYAPVQMSILARVTTAFTNNATIAICCGVFPGVPSTEDLITGLNYRSDAAALNQTIYYMLNATDKTTAAGLVTGAVGNPMSVVVRTALAGAGVMAIFQLTVAYYEITHL